MSFDYSIIADPASAIAALNKNQAAMESIEKMAVRLGSAITKGFQAAAIKDAEGRFIATGVAASKTTKEVDALAAATKREADILERIKGPERDYIDDLNALDALLNRNAISTKEYADQITLLNHKMGERPNKGHAGGEGEHGGGLETEGLGRAIAGQFGEVGAVGAGIAGGVFEVAGVAALATEVVHLGDEYTNLANKAVRFVDAGHDTNTILHDQAALSREVHGSLEQTVEIYSSVREGTDELNLSYQDQIDLAKSLAQEVQLSGKGLDQAGGLMAKLSFAFQSGTLTGRELKGMFREFPALAETLRDEFGKTTTELMNMANKGTLAPSAIIEALINKGPEITERFGHLAETASMKWQHFKDEFFTLGVGAAIDVNSLPNQLKQAGVDTETLGQKIRKLVDPLGVAAEKAGQLADQMNRATQGPFSFVQKRLDDIKEAADATRRHIALSNAAVEREETEMADAAKIRADARFDAHIKLMESKYKKFWEEVKGGERDYRFDLELLNDAMGRGAITAKQFVEELGRITSRGPEAHLEDDIKKRTDAWVAQAKAAREANQFGIVLPSSVGLTGINFSGAERQAMEDLKLAKQESAKADADLADQERTYLGLMTQNATAADRFRDEQLALNHAKEKGIIDTGTYNEFLDNLRQKYGAASSPAEKLNQELRVAHDLFEAGALSATDYAHKLESVKKAQEQISDSGKDLTSGVNRGLHSIRDEMLDVASAADKTLVDAFHGVEDAIVTAAMTGKLSFSGMIDTMLNDLSRLALKILEQKLIMSFIGGGDPNGLWANNGIPGHATGTSYTVAGHGGTDSSLQAFWATPGERVTVETPEQQGGGSSSRNASGGGGPVSVAVHNHYDKRELLSAVRTPEGHTEIINVVRENAGAIRSILQK